MFLNSYYNLSNSFMSVIDFIIDLFSRITSFMDHIILFGSSSLLDLLIAIVVMSILFTSLFTVVRSTTRAASSVRVHRGDRNEE